MLSLHAISDGAISDLGDSEVPASGGFVGIGSFAPVGASIAAASCAFAGAGTATIAGGASSVASVAFAGTGAFTVVGKSMARALTAFTGGGALGSTSSSTFDAAGIGRVSNPIILVEIDFMREVAGAPELDTLCIADKPFESKVTDTPSLTPYDDALNNLASYVRTMDKNKLIGGYTVSLGNVEIRNPDGAYDDLLRYAFDGSEIRVYYGDESWDKNDFFLVFKVLGQNITVTEPKILAINVKDSSSLLNSNLSSYASIGGTGPRANEFKPINLGYVHNVEFIIQNVGSNIYCYGNSTTDATVVAVRDNGSTLTPVSEWTDNGDGTVTLIVTPVGQITGDVLELPTADPDAYRVSNIFTTLAGDFAGLLSRGLFLGPHSSFIVADADDAHVGISLRDSGNLMPHILDIMESGNAFFAVDRYNRLYYARIRPDDITGESQLTIEDDDIVPPDAIKIEELVPLYDRIQAVGNQNWTPKQNSLAGILTADEVALYTRDGYTFTEPAPSGTTYLSNPALYHKTMGPSPTIPTLISRATDVDVDGELQQFSETRRTMLLSWVQIIDVTVDIAQTPDALPLMLGDVVTLAISRFGFAGGKACQVIGIGIRLSDKKIDLTLCRREPAVASFFIQQDDDFFVQQDDTSKFSTH